MKKIIAVGVLLFAGMVGAQEAKAPAFQPSEVQTLRLQVKQKEAQLKQVQAQLANSAFQQALQSLLDEGEKVKTENKWGPEIVFDANSVTFSEVKAPKPAPKKPVDTEKKQ